MLKAPDDDPPNLHVAENPTLVALRGVRETLSTVHAEIFRKLDDEIRQLRPMETQSIELVGSPGSRGPLSPVERFSGERRSVTMQEHASPLAYSVEDRSLTDRPRPPGQLGEDLGTSVVPAQPRSRTDPKAFLPSLSKKQKGRNYFRSQAAQDLCSPRQSDRGSEMGKRQILRSQEKDLPWRKSLEGNGIFGGMRSQFSIESVQMHALTSMAFEEKADNSCAKIVSHPHFDRFMMLVVILNCIEMAISVEFGRDETRADAVHTALLVSGNVFCITFLVEICLRWMSYARCVRALQDGWFLFDLALVLLMMWETWAMPFVVVSDHNDVSGAWRMARILRVLRTARMARLVRLIPELMILIKGMIVACRSVFFTLMLLLIITFIFSIAFLELSSHTPLEQEYFRSIPDAIVSLILHCIVPDQEVFFKSLAEESWILGVLVLLFILLGSLTVMNMLLGVLVEAVKTVSTIEQEQMMADFARKVLWGLIQDDTEMQEVDYQQRMISEKEFKSLLRKPRAVTALLKLGVDAGAALDYGRMLFEDDESVSFVEFMHAMLTLRGSNKATVKDIVELRKYIGEEFTQIRSVLSELCTFIGDTLWTSTDRFKA